MAFNDVKRVRKYKAIGGLGYQGRAGTQCRCRVRVTNAHNKNGFENLLKTQYFQSIQTRLFYAIDSADPQPEAIQPVF